MSDQETMNDFAAVCAPENDRKLGYVLVLFIIYAGKAMLLAIDARCDQGIYESLRLDWPADEGVDITDAVVPTWQCVDPTGDDHAIDRLEGGVYVARARVETEGWGEDLDAWPVVEDASLATPEEWSAHLDGEWPWGLPSGPIYERPKVAMFFGTMLRR